MPLKFCKPWKYLLRITMIGVTRYILHGEQMYTPCAKALYNAACL